MNQERFDELTRTLATAQVSRLQVLKVLLGSVLVGLFSSWGGVRVANAKVAPGTCTTSPDDPNRVIGDCLCFLDNFEAGVWFQDEIDPQTGQWRWERDPKAFAATLIRFPPVRIGPEALSEDCKVCVKKGNSFDCTPKPCFLIDRTVEARYDQVCVTTTYKTSYPESWEIYQLRWTPSPSACDECGCNLALADFEAEVLAHEHRHVADYQNLLKELNARTQNLTITDICDKSLAGSKQETEREIDLLLSKAEKDFWNAHLRDRRDKDERIFVEGLSAYFKYTLCPQICAPCLSTQAQAAALTSTQCCPQGQVECNGQCVATCQAPLVLNQNTCQCEDPGACDPPCGACETCQQGTCVTKTCPEGQSCDPSTGQCQASCPEGQEPCGEGGPCCPPEQCDPFTGLCSQCPEGEQPCGDSGECCPPDQCDPSTGLCGSGAICDPPCDPCETCNQQTGVCEGGCGQCEDCDVGRCIAWGQPCGETCCSLGGETCEGGTCRPCKWECETSGENGIGCAPRQDVQPCGETCCEAGRICCSGTCCSTCQVCEDGTCRDCKPACETCENGDCNPRSDVFACGETCCGEGQFCEGGRCIPRTTLCGGSVQCNAPFLGDTCSDGGPSGNGVCQITMGGSCICAEVGDSDWGVCEPACDTNADCPSGYVCLQSQPDPNCIPSPGFGCSCAQSGIPSYCRQWRHVNR